MEVEKYRVFEELIEGIQVISPDWKYFYVNNAVVRQGRLSREELIGKRMMEMYPGIENTEMFSLLRSCMEEGNAQQMINEFFYPDGSRAWFELSMQAVPEGVLILSFDISKQKEAEFQLAEQLKERSLMLQQITEQKKQLEEFCHIIAHNMRAPLANLLLLSDMVHDSDSVDEQMMFMVKQKPIVDYLHELFDELVEAMQVKIDHSIQKDWLKLRDSVETAAKLLQGDILNLDVNLNYDFSAAEMVLFSKNYLDSIIFNLISNAIKYRSEERALVINLKSYERDNWVCLDVKDNGLGIDLKKYGDKLFKLRQTFHNQLDSKGFGLFISRTQVEALGGKLTAKSTPGEGSTFTIHFAK